MDLENQIQSLLTTIEDGWRDKNGEMYAAKFADDAEFCGFTGKYLKGKSEIIEWHNDIFEGVYSNTILKITIERIREINDDIVTVDAGFELLQKGGTYFAPGWALSHMLIKKYNDGWKILQIYNSVPYEPVR